MNLKPLKRKEASKILEQVGQEYGCDAKKLLIDDHAFFISDKNKIYFINNSIKEADLTNIRINSFGLYFCEINHDKIRLTIEASQLIGPTATKNIFEVDDQTARSWLKGEDIECDQEFEGFVIVKNKADFLSSGRYKEGKILNFIPKIRRIMASD